MSTDFLKFCLQIYWPKHLDLSSILKNQQRRDLFRAEPGPVMDFSFQLLQKQYTEFLKSTGAELKQVTANLLGSKWEIRSTQMYTRLAANDKIEETNYQCPLNAVTSQTGKMQLVEAA